MTAAILVANCAGTLTITNCTSANTTIEILASGLDVTLDASCTAGVISLSGVGSLTNNATSLTSLSNNLLSPTSVGAAAGDALITKQVVEACPFREGYPTLEARWPANVTPGTVTVDIYDLNSGTPAVAIASGLATVAGPGTNSYLFDTSSRTGLAGDLSPSAYTRYLFKFNGTTAAQAMDVEVFANTGRDVLALYGDGVHQNSVTGVALPTPGTFTFGYGSLDQPVTTMEDAATVRNALGLPAAYIVLPATFSPAAPTTDWAAARIVGRGDTSFVPATAVTVHLNRSQLEDVQLNCFTGGGFSGSYIVRRGRAVGMNLNTSGDQLWDRTQIEGTWTWGAGIWDSTFLQCLFLGATLNVVNRGSSSSFDFVDIRGTVTIDQLPAGTSVVMSGDNMDITFGASCGAGCTALIEGSGTAQDLSGNVAITFDPTARLSDAQNTDTNVANVSAQVLAQNPFIDLAALRNTVSDVQDYDAQGFLLRQRTRVFANDAAALAATRVQANAAGVVSVVSSDAADTTQTVTVAGLVGGTPTTDVISLTGTTPAAGAVSFDRGTITGVTLSAGAAGTVTLTDSGATTLLTAAPGATQVGEGEGELFTQIGVGRVDATHNTLPRDLVVTVA